MASGLLKKWSQYLAKVSRRFYRFLTTDRVSMRFRIGTVLFVLALIFSVIILRLINIQILNSSDKYAAQVDQLVQEVELTAERGNIYDRNMNILVQDSSAKSVNVIPSKVEDPEAVANEISQTLGEDYQSVYQIVTKLEDDKVELSNNTYKTDTGKLLELLGNDEAYSIEANSLYVIPEKVKNVDKDAGTIAAALEINEDDVKKYLTKKENTPQPVKTKVDNEVAEKIQSAFKTEENEEDPGGIRLIDDKKRYYTNGTFASHVLGFTGNAHEGLYGVEKAFDSQLSGTKEIVYYQRDANDNIITSQTKVVQEEEKGEDLVLSLDSNVQSIAEKALQSGIDSWEADSGTAIVMNVKSGEIIAMASKPDYDLNDPYAISEEFAAKHQSDLAGLSKAEQREQMWRNPAVSFIYEPGSTFKPITVSTALEEGAINPSMTFNCTGTYRIPGSSIVVHCTGIHGEQTISQALENSCNPALIQIIENVDPNIFYKYAYNYGFGQRTGIELTGEEEGIVNRIFNEDGTIQMVDYSTFSFGQGLATTPIQLICALNALINNGDYVIPTILKDGGQESPRQIVSEATSSTLRQEMQAVIDTKPVLKALCGNYQIGGKTGTAEKFKDGAYKPGVYVTSFFCFAPTDDPEYACLVILDEPRSDAFGSTSAAPVAIEILKQALVYSGSDPNESAPANVLVPECTNVTLSEIEPVLKERGITYRVEKKEEGDYVIAQSIPAQTTYTGGELVLTTSVKPAENSRTVPDLTGKTVQSVNETIKQLGMHLKVQGSGFAVEQSIPPGTVIEPDMEITVRFQE